MPFLQLDPISLSLAGGAVLLLGIAHLLLTGRGAKPSWRWPLALAGGFLVLTGLSWVCGLPQAAMQAALLLAIAEGILALLRSPAQVVAHRALALIAHPASQAAILLLLGGALLGAQLYRIDQELESELQKTDLELGQLSNIILPDQPAGTALTDAGRPIPLFTPNADASLIDNSSEERFLSNLALQWKLIKTAPAELRYNCHGWVFTAGNYWVRGSAVPKILEDHKYVAVTKPQPGDLIVFRDQANEVTHTGIVRSASEGGPVLIESKWGKLGRFIHTVDEHAYRAHAFTYYRSPRGTHILKGQEESKEPMPVVALPRES